jgi:hypothetical protein
MVCGYRNKDEDIKTLIQAVSQEVQQKKFDADYSSPYSAKAKNGRTVPPLLLMSSCNCG